MSGVVIGSNLQNGEPVSLASDSRTRGLYIIGTNGTGKTTLIENIAVQDVVAGEGVCVLDPHGDLTDRLIRRIEPLRADDLVVLDARNYEFPFGLNP